MLSGKYPTEGKKPPPPPAIETEGKGLNSDDDATGGFLSDLLAKLGPKNAEAVPLPLLVLAGISLLLLATAGASFLARRMQARRLEVAPASAAPDERA